MSHGPRMRKREEKRLYNIPVWQYTAGITLHPIKEISWAFDAHYSRQNYIDYNNRFKNDNRILMWDLYNEPGNTEMGEKSLPLLKKTFEWAREIDPLQPLTSGIWLSKLEELNEFQLNNSDIITFHNYNDADNLTAQIKELKKYNRPLICTEYMARINNCLFQTQMPIFKKEKVGCYNWGFVKGKTQTTLPWKELVEKSPEGLWFHDILNSDGTPYDKKEIEFIKSIL